jgi:hypothetical protein
MPDTRDSDPTSGLRAMTFDREVDPMAWLSREPAEVTNGQKIAHD